VHQTEIVTIANATAALERITAMNHTFLTHAKEHSTHLDIPSSLQISGDDVAINCFGHVATAKPRPVCTPNNIYCMEYVFTVPFGDQMIEVTRFYLTEYGSIKDTPNDQNTVCDSNNTLIARHLCGRALLGFLKSPLLKPAQVQR
jgi:hypothetical protein